MPVQFDIASHPSKPVSTSHYPLANPGHLLQQTWGAAGETGANKYQELLQSSFARNDLSRAQPRQNGLIDTVVAAYCSHHHLVLRPDDIWTAILCQFNLYVNAHSEELRTHFVAHEGKKTLTVRATGTRYTVDFGNMARQMAEEIHKNVVDETLKDWILPDFTTTTHHDTVVAAVMMMATLKAYFDYVFCLDCGIPSITLEGEKEDWEKILRRLDKLDEFGEEPTAWAKMLRPILKRFVDAFDGGKHDTEFWGRICDYQEGSGVAYISGWITAFCFWDTKGKSLAGSDDSRLEVDGVRYHAVDIKSVPVGYCEVDVLLIDNGDKFECMMVAGHVGSTIEGQRDTLRPLSGWFMFIKAGCKVPPIDAKQEARLAGGPAGGVSYGAKKKRTSWIGKLTGHLRG
ncbi:hypothetical protein NLJ89_g8841 [Agrocybe chaxingu]|uniref:Uncharacterized protein n=1 Tax=Agrocybe chaxingu TaxID=84603 RepID=A0A9W8K1Q6_9AGAR|nr:hypothetical protein NLJ89_g8841 [Agrocybe chaxingu]